MAAMITIANANALHIPLADRSVQCIVTSPPYFGLRDYGTAKWEGGSAECDHKQTTARNDAGRVNTNGFHGSASDDSDKGAINYRDICPRCGARRIDAQIGLESTPAAYVANIVAVMRECWRVLKDDGVMWLNLGDSYAGSSMNGGGKESSTLVGTHHTEREGARFDGTRLTPGLKPKDLCGIPWRVAFALQDDGWYLRQDIIWAKPNPMPESVTDRCTKSHEYVFLLTKRARYYYDAEAIKEPIQPSSIERAKYGWNGHMEFDENGKETYRSQPDPVEQMGERWSPSSGRNRRSVWTVATQPYSGAHFATFPPALIEPMILAGSRRGDVVLDPFAGSGTTGAVAVKHGRRAVLLDLNTKYIDLQFERTNGVQMMFETIAPNSPSNDVAR